MIWRLDDYYNPGLTVAGGDHLMDTSRRMQDHDLTLLPQSNLQFHLGYSRNTKTGRRFPRAGVRRQRLGLPDFHQRPKRQWNEYRLGADGTFHGFQFTVLRRWDFFKDDTPATSAGVEAAGDADAI